MSKINRIENEESSRLPQSIGFHRTYIACLVYQFTVLINEVTHFY